MVHFFVVLLCLSHLTFAEVPETDKLAESLIRLRTDVETLDADVSQMREDNRLAIQTLKVQQGELAASIEAEKLKRDQLKTQIGELKGQLSQKGFEDKQMKETVISGIQQMKEYVEASIPFQSEKRLKELSELEEKVASDKITSVKAAIRLWSFIEDELRSATENSVFRQTIEVAGTEQLVEVAKLGSIFLYYKTGDGQYGTVEKAEGKWNFRRLTTSQEQTQVATLFESLKKQIRTGQFEVPNQLKGRL